MLREPRPGESEPSPDAISAAVHIDPPWESAPGVPRSPVPSDARQELDRALKDVAEVISAHEALTGGGAGRPAQARGAAVTRAGVVLLVAATEAFIEDLFAEAAHKMWPGDRRLKDYLETIVTGDRAFANPSVKKTNDLFFGLGMPWVLDSIRWQKRTNKSFKESLTLLIKRRNQIAHGSKPRPSVQLRQLRAWHRMIAVYAERLESLVAARIEAVTGHRPNW
ncbi:MAG: HEPN domain-containing protein [Gaiellaceae bacterium]